MEEQIKEALTIAKENQKKLEEHSNEINNNLNGIKKNSFALDLVKQMNEGNKHWYKFAKLVAIAFIINTLLLAGVTIYLIKTLNDIGTIEETTTTQEVEQQNENGDNNFIGNDGDINYGKTEN